MRIKALTILAALLMTSTVTAASIDAKSLAIHIRDARTADNDGFMIVYGGQDISRGSINLESSRMEQPVRLG